jgi:hypothetical protein
LVLQKLNHSVPRPGSSVAGVGVVLLLMYFLISQVVQLTLYITSDLSQGFNRSKFVDIACLLNSKSKLRVEINQLMTDGLIELSTSEWSSPAILVPKPGGAVRCCIDYRAVNVLILDDNFPMNRIDDIIERIGHVLNS